MKGRHPPHRLHLAVQYASNARSLPTRSQLRRWIRTALQCDAAIALRIVDEPEGRTLNKRYRGRDRATNVLTFVYDDAQPRHGGVKPSGAGGVARRLHSRSAGSGRSVTQPPILSGDIVICAPVAAREAVAQHKDLTAHYAHLTIHAALHLQGYLHETDSDASEMETLERAIMLKLRYPDPYPAI
jgi:probable rRNA maturation factor